MVLLPFYEERSSFFVLCIGEQIKKYILRSKLQSGQVPWLARRPKFGHPYITASICNSSGSMRLKIDSFCSAQPSLAMFCCALLPASMPRQTLHIPLAISHCQITLNKNAAELIKQKSLKLSDWLGGWASFENFIKANISLYRRQHLSTKMPTINGRDVSRWSRGLEISIGIDPIHLKNWSEIKWS